jgi:Spy/CpxP family protein refolding chaperone
MRRKILICIMIIIHVGLSAQSHIEKKQEGPKKGRGLMNDLKTELNLTQEQEGQIKPILEANRSAMKLNREKYKGNAKCMRKAKYQQRKKTRAEIEKILTPEQNQKWKAIKEKRKEENRKKREEYLNSPIEC